ncbi:MAG: DUF2807 domain-containing protein [Bacteroidia bacterium]|nr:DUF2807 domain-containing protein [Bacteroidia bacterium]
MKTLSATKLIVLASSLFLFSCSDNGICIKGQGELETRTLSLSEFTGVGLSRSANVTIRQGNVQEVRVTGEPNILDRLETKVSGGIWDIDLERGCYRSYDLDVDIVVPNLDLISVSGSGDITIKDFENQRNLDLSISGSGDINLNRFEGLNTLDINVSGSGDIIGLDTIKNVNLVEMRFSGSGNYQGYPILTKACDVNISGSADCYISVEDELDVRISGSGNVFYKGNPQITQSITGSGKLRSRN